MHLNFLRTPESCFQKLPGYNFNANYVEDLSGYEGLRVHFLDEGPKNNTQTFLCLHGQPSWSYLYRKMIPIFTAAGHRSIAPDFLGFGRSDKPRSEETYTFNFHRNLIIGIIKKLDLQNIILVCQDWGGIIGLTIPMEMSDLFNGLIVMNTTFGTGDLPLGKGFLDWRKFNNENPDMKIGNLFKRSCPNLSVAECKAYDAPFPDIAYKSGVRKFPNLVPGQLNAEGAHLSRKAKEWFSNAWNGKTFMAVGMKDPVLGPKIMANLRRHIKGCPEPLEIQNAGHFVQEEGQIIAQKALECFELI